MTVQSIDYLAIGPPLVLALAALAVLLVDAFAPRARRAPVAGTALTGLLLAGVATVLAGANVLSTGDARGTFCLPGDLRAGGPASCSYVVDEFTLLFQAVVLVAGAVVLLMALQEIRRTELPAGEFHFLLLTSVAGALAIAGARDLITLVVCLEVVSLPVFALVALRRYDGRSSEAGLKMFLVSVVSTAVMLFGISLVYGATGAVHLDRIAEALAGEGTAARIAAVGIVGVLVGFAFKIAAVPFHFWAPDTYHGAPVAVAAFLSVVSKAAGFAGLVLVLAIGFAGYAAVWGPMLAVLAAVSMTIGNLVALRQRNPVRLLAWSSVAQAGYMLAPLGAVGGLAGLSGQDELRHDLLAATVGYVAIYAVMNIGAFAVVGFVAGLAHRQGGADLSDYRGLAREHPGIAVALAFFLACLAGLPPGLAGLFAKVVVFQAAVDGGYGWLAILMAINTVLGLAYYLAWARLLFAPATQPPERSDPRPVVPAPGPVRFAIGLAAVGTIALCVLPSLVLGVAPIASAGVR